MAGGIVVIVALRADPIVGFDNYCLAVPPSTALVACKVAVATNLLPPRVAVLLQYETYGPKMNKFSPTTGTVQPGNLMQIQFCP